ncbi:hypothetical protein BD770DRAFT_378672 [Pilaira anomala]|nr:hypothetical protein BD770DRAFT_378672 [Pilaira anomala]
MTCAVAMAGVAMNNAGAALVVVVMIVSYFFSLFFYVFKQFLILILEIMLFVVCWHLKAKEQNRC